VTIRVIGRLIARNKKLTPSTLVARIPLAFRYLASLSCLYFFFYPNLLYLEWSRQPRSTIRFISERIASVQKIYFICLTVLQAIRLIAMNAISGVYSIDWVDITPPNITPLHFFEKMEITDSVIVSFRSQRNPGVEYPYIITIDQLGHQSPIWECGCSFFIDTGRTCKHHYALKILKRSNFFHLVFLKPTSED